MTNSRRKGADAELKALGILQSKFPQKQWRLTPGSGNGLEKGDITYTGCKYCIEVKHYKDSPITDKVLTNKSNNLSIWWKKLLTHGKIPVLIVKYNRSKWFVMTKDKPKCDYIYFSQFNAYLYLLDNLVLDI